MIARRVAPLLLATALVACVPASEPLGTSAPAPVAETVQPVRTPTPAPAPASMPPSAISSRPQVFTFAGELTQGGFLRGTVPGGAVSVKLDGESVAFASDGRFFAAFDRDAGTSATLIATMPDGREIRSPVSISPRDWQIERINVARTPGGASDAYMKIRQPELDAIWASRQKQTGAQGWRQEFIWPVKGRISGRFGSQRIYRGEPGAYHTGLDISTGTSGTPYVAPADGVVVLAVQGYSLEGNLLIIDHGNGLNSAFLHSSRLYVKEGDAVTQGQHIGDIGMSGRATGPHLHWSIKWHEARLDPLLFTGPMR